MAQQPPLGQGLFNIEASRSPLDTPHSIGLLWTSNYPDAETSTRQHTTLTNDRHSCPTPGLIRNHNPNKRTAADPRLRPSCHWERQSSNYRIIFQKAIIMKILLNYLISYNVPISHDGIFLSCFAFLYPDSDVTNIKCLMPA